MAEPGSGDPEAGVLLVLDEVTVREHLALTAIREYVAATDPGLLVDPLRMTAGMMRDPRRGPELNRRAGHVGEAANFIGGLTFLLAGLAAVEEAQDGSAAGDQDAEAGELVSVK